MAGAVATGTSTTIPFTADAGTVSYFAASPDCSATGLQWVVEDSAGVALAGAAVICGDIGRVEFPTAGDYHVRVYSDGTGDGGDFSIIRKESRPDRILTIASGESIEGDIDLPGAQDIYEFEPAAGTVAYFASADCATSDLQWVVEDTAGAPAAGAAVVCNDIGRIDFTASGRYRVRVYSVDGGTGKYEVDWKPSRPDRTLAISSGETVEGDIDLSGAQDVYEFDVEAGTVAYFAAAADCSQNDRYWVVEDASGVAVASTSVICGDIGRVVFPTAGHFRLRVYSVDGGTGKYEVQWKPSRPDRTLAISSGETVEGDIDLSGAQDVYEFDVEAGTVAYFAAAEDCSQNDRYWTVEDAAGGAFTRTNVICGDIGRVAFPAAGHFRLRVYSVDGGTGTYGVTWVTSRPDKQRPLRIGSATSGAIDLPGSQDMWTFTAGPGGSVTLTADPECSAQDLRWVVLAADGTAVTPPSVLCDDIGSVALPSAGDYQVVVYADGPATGDYTFRVGQG